MTLYLARHGETTWNLEGRLQGQRFGGELTALGRSQAEDLAALAPTLGLTRLYSSPLDRALTTARLVSQATGLPATVHETLAEVDFGDAIGLTLSEVEVRWPGFTARREADRWRTPWPGGESYEALVARARGFLDAIRPEPEGATLIVAHQTMNRALLVALGAATFEAVLASRQPSHLLLIIEGQAVQHRVVGPEGTPAQAGLWRAEIL